jgi:hypothetical protein
MLFPSSGQLLERFRAFGSPIVFGASSCLFPDRFISRMYSWPMKRNKTSLHNPKYPSCDEANTDSLYLNGGAVVGEKWAFRMMIDRVQSYGTIVTCGSSEQRGLHRFYLENPKLVTLDFGSIIFKNLRWFPVEAAYIDGSGQLQLFSHFDTPTGVLDPTWNSSWQISPCLFHGSSSRGKIVYSALVTFWLEGLRQRRNTISPHSIKIPVVHKS